MLSLPCSGRPTCWTFLQVTTTQDSFLVLCYGCAPNLFLPTQRVVAAGSVQLQWMGYIEHNRSVLHIEVDHWTEEALRMVSTCGNPASTSPMTTLTAIHTSNISFNLWTDKDPFGAAWRGKLRRICIPMPASDGKPWQYTHSCFFFSRHAQQTESCLQHIFSGSENEPCCFTPVGRALQQCS